MSNRRKFLKTAAAGSVALALQSYTGKAAALAKPTLKSNKPIVLSTWNFDCKPMAQPGKYYKPMAVLSMRLRPVFECLKPIQLNAVLGTAVVPIATDG